MPLPFPQGETVTILRPGETVRDSAGNYVPGPDQEIPVAGCPVWPTSTDERLDGQDQTVEALTVLVPYDVEVRPTDRMRIYGRVFTVRGEAQSWKSPLTGTRAGQQIQLERVVG